MQVDDVLHALCHIQLFVEFALVIVVHHFGHIQFGEFEFEIVCIIFFVDFSYFFAKLDVLKVYDGMDNLKGHIIIH